MTRTMPSMPPFGVADVVLASVASPGERFKFWLLTHAQWQGKEFWRTAVLRECTPSTESVDSWPAGLTVPIRGC